MVPSKKDAGCNSIDSFVRVFPACVDAAKQEDGRLGRMMPYMKALPKWMRPKVARVSPGGDRGAGSASEALGSGRTSDTNVCGQQPRASRRLSMSVPSRPRRSEQAASSSSACKPGGHRPKTVWELQSIIDQRIIAARFPWTVK